jgi:uracil-DNA glycosylase family protein
MHSTQLAQPSSDPLQPTDLPAVGRQAAAAGADLANLGALASGCRACELWERATQTVFGAGPSTAQVMLVGEQPGDQEDRAGRPFIGPAGRILDDALGAAGIDREKAFVTNVVKHFRWRPSGKRRLHERPTQANIRACRPWLDAELTLVRPDALVLLGATAAQSIVGRHVRVAEAPARPLVSDLAPLVVATLHPSAILRSGDDREAQFDRLVTDLRLVADWIASA